MAERLVGLVARHGATVLNDNDCFRGWRDVPLDKKGEREAKAAARFLKKYEIRQVLTSPLLRAFTTANIEAAPHGVAVVQHRGLFPWNVGVFAGLDKKTNQDALRLFVKSPEVTIPSGESLDAFEERQFAFWSNALRMARNSGLTLFVAHTSNVVALVNSTTDDAAVEMENAETIEPGGVAEIYWNGKQHRVEPVFREAGPAAFTGS